MNPLASTRISLAWPPDPPAEDEDVVVISGRTGFFIDLRTARTRAPDSAGGAEGAGEVDAWITWATVGWKELLPLDEGEEHPRARFTAILDSRRPASSSTSPTEDDVPSDEGSFETLPTGDVLEKGVMHRPETGQLAPYEEVWRRLPLSPDGGTVRVLLLEWMSADGRERAFVGSVGDYELGLVDAPGGFGAVRREKRAGQWETVLACGAGRGLPSLAGVRVLEEVDELELAGRKWRVIEAGG
ncbi:hypothetical protein JCM10450v2_003757 [Rhodotorula kratochvilovae]